MGLVRPADPERLLGRKVLAANTLWNLAGNALPAVVGILASPAIIRGFGPERFGLLTLAWVAIGYFSLFDLGLGRAVTKLAAERLHDERVLELRPLFWTASLLLLVLGLIAGLLPVLPAHWIVTHGIKITATMRPEALQSLYILAAALPAVVLATGFRGFLEGGQHFVLVNAVRVPFGVSTFVIPLVSLHYTHSLIPTIAGLAVARVVAGIAYWLMCVAILRGRTGRAAPTPLDRSIARELLGFGAWVTVSNVVGPLMVTFDRFVVGSLISVAMVTYYATPFQAVLQFLIVPSAIAAVLFPAFATAYVHGPERLSGLISAGTRAIFLLLYPCVVLVVAFAPELLGLWLGEPFPRLSSTVMRWLAVGVLANGLAQIPFALIQGVGRSDLTAKIHLSELPLYAVSLILVAKRFGIDGVAVAWCMRAIADLAILAFVGARVVHVKVRVRPGAIAGVAAAGALLAICSLAPDLTSRAVAAAVSLSIFAWLGWNKVLRSGERLSIRSRFSALQPEPGSR